MTGLPAPEPRFVRVAAAIGDPTRARMLATLLSGEFRSAGELAQSAGVTAQAASTQLALLLDTGLLSARRQGRHKYFALADADVAHALEALSLVGERDNVSTRWQQPRLQPMKTARRCYGHLAGELGVAQFGLLLRRGYLVAGKTGLQLSHAGRAWLADMGLAAPELPATKSAARLAYPCLDWSERRDHMAGSLAKALLEHYLAQGWLRAQAGSRALAMTPLGWLKLAYMVHDQAKPGERQESVGR